MGCLLGCKIDLFKLFGERIFLHQLSKKFHFYLDKGLLELILCIIHSNHIIINFSQQVQEVNRYMVRSLYAAREAFILTPRQEYLNDNVKNIKTLIFIFNAIFEKVEWLEIRFKHNNQESELEKGHFRSSPSL